MRVIRVFFVFFIFCMSILVQAVPAYRGKVKMRQPDGSILLVQIVGDEYGHHYQDEEGVIFLPNNDGTLCYAMIDEHGNLVADNLVAHNRDSRNELEKRLVAAQDKQAILHKLEKERVDARARQSNKIRNVTPGKITQTFPTMGEVEGLVVLAEYQDVKFSTPDIKTVYEQLANQENYSGSYATGSVRDYFIDQSNGQFKPHFTVVGPVTLPNKRAYYGTEEKNVEMILDACNEAQLQGVDFSKFDANGDGHVDFVYVVYAGYGEAQGGPLESIWPSAVDLTYESWKTYDGLYLSKSACSCELHGNEGTQLDGIGTFCHEFSHILGLADIYDTNKGGTGFGMSDWDVMDHGCYNNDSKTPAGYTAMDKYTVGWLTPTVLDVAGKDYQLKALATSNEAYFIVNPEDNNEYFTLENRQPVKWDAGLPGHGLIVSHIHYVKSLWGSNRVNASNSGYEHVSLVPADNNKSNSTLDGDPYPGTSNNTSLTDTSVPATYWRVGSALVNAPVTNIREQDGIILFDFKADEVGIVDTVYDGLLKMSIHNRIISIDNDLGNMISVFTADGKLIHKSSEKCIQCHLTSGTYIISTEGFSKKISIQ